MTRIHFLCYAPRSGSTFFARCLAARCDDLLVVPEFRAHVALLAEGEERVRRSSVERIVRLLERDVQLTEGLGLGQTALRAAAGAGVSEGIAALVRHLVSEYARRQGRSADTALLKKGTILDLYAEVQHVFPDAKFLHLVRDGRAVASSLLRTDAAYSAGEKMGRDILHASRVWTRQQERVAHLRPALGDRLLEVRYEDLIADERRSCEEAGRFLGCRVDPNVDPPDDSAPGGPFTVAAAERGMHRLVEHGPITARRTAWRDELPAWQGLVFEIEGGALLEQLGYATRWRATASPLRKLAALARSRLGHVAATLRWALRRLWRYRSDPGAIIQRGRTRRQRRLGQRREV